MCYHNDIINRKDVALKVWEQQIITEKDITQ